MNPRYQLQNPDEVLSPGLLFYPDVIQRNIDRLLQTAGDASRLRPHIKTFKTREVVRMQMRSGLRKFKCATIAEAEMLGECSAPDVLIAYPLVGPNLRRLMKLKARFPDVRFSSLVDCETSTRHLSEAACSAGMVAGVFIDLDIGMHRTGIPIHEGAARLYELMADQPGLQVEGIHAYDGHNADPNLETRQSVANSAYDEVMELKEKLERKGLPVPSVVMGGTPPLGIYTQLKGIESSPGTCFLHDWGYGSKFADLGFEPAALVLGRIISKPTGKIVCIDVGYKAISADPPGDRGTFLNIEGAELGRQNEEHWTFEADQADDLCIGQEVYVLPTHICPTVALYDFANVIDTSGRCIDQWEIRARRRVLSI